MPAARRFEKNLEALAAALPTDISGPGGLDAYRRAARSRATTSTAAAHAAAPLGLSTSERTVAGLAVTAFLPAQPVAARVLFLHGGGLIAGDRYDGVDVVTRHASALALEVWTIEYPLAPENTFDVIADAVVAVVVPASEDGLPLLLAGQSAGGGIAAEVALRAAERGVRVDGQLLICPMLARADAESAEAFRDDRSWSSANSAAAWRAALGDSPVLPPGERPGLPVLAPTYLDAGAAELFRDPITDFATALWRRGNRAELHIWSGGFHAFDTAAEDAAVSVHAHRSRGDWIRRWLRDDL